MAQCNIQGLVDSGIALQVIIDYADNGGIPPAVSDYQKIGVLGVKTENLNDVNDAIKNVDKEAADTVAEIQAIVNGLDGEISSLNKIAAYADDSVLNVAPELNDFTNIGVNGVTAENLESVNSFIDAAQKNEADTKDEIQLLVNKGISFQKIMDYAEDSNTNTAPEVSDYQKIGIVGVSDANINEVNSVIDSKEKVDVNSVAELQAIINSTIDTIEAISLIADYAENGGLPKPSVDTYKKAGVEGVDTSNIDDVNERISSLEKSDVNSADDIQDVVDSVNAFIKIEEYANNESNSIPTIEEYEEAGITGVTDDNLQSINNTVRALERNEVDTLAKLQGLVDGIIATIEAIELISEYAQNDGVTTTELTQSTFDDANITIPSNVTIAEIKEILITLEGENVDTKPKIEVLLESISALNKIEAYAESSDNSKPTVDDYKKAGVVGVTAKNINDVNNAVNAKEASDVNTVKKLQDVIDNFVDGVKAISIISEYAHTNGDTTPPTQKNYDDINVTIPSNTTVADINEKLKSFEKIDVDTKEEIQTLINITSSHNTIKDYADGDVTEPIVNDYTLIGVTGVNDENITALNAAVKAIESSEVDTVDEIQNILSLVDEVLAIEKIKSYAQNDGGENIPDADVYLKAGVTIPANVSVDEINEKIITLVADDVDTKEEIQTLINIISAHNTIKDYADSDTTEPTIENYTLIGVTGVNDENITALNAAVKAIESSEVDTVDEIQNLLSLVDAMLAIEKIKNYAQNNGGENAPDTDDYLKVGVTIPANTTIEDINEVIATLEAIKVDTPQEIQGIIAKVSSYNTIKDYADDSTETAPSVEDYDNVGVVGVTESNLIFVNAAVAAEVSEEIDELDELQYVISVAVSSVNAMNQIVEYAQNNGVNTTVPTATTYASVGAKIPSNVTLNQINTKVASLGKGDVDTLVEIQDIIDTISSFNTIVAYAESKENDEPTVDDYVQLEISGVTAENLEYVNTIIDSKSADEVDTMNELKAVIVGAIESAAALNKIMNYAENDSNAPMPGIDTYAKIGLMLPVGVTLAELNEKIASLEKENVDTVLEISDIINTIYSFNKIKAYADDSKNDTPTVDDYKLVGVVGVSDTNINTVNILIDGYESLDIDTLEKLQRLISNGLVEIAAIDKISTYADEDGLASTPAEETYRDAKITIPENVSVNEINDVVKTLNKIDVDTISEIQDIVNEISSYNRIEDYAEDNTKDKPSLEDFTTIGIIGVTEDNLSKVIDAIDALEGDAVDSFDEIQNIVNGILKDIALEKISEYAHSDGVEDEPTQNDYDKIGVDLRELSVGELNLTIVGLEKEDVDSAAEIQDLIDSIVAINKIEAYADDNKNSKPTVEDYEDAGVNGVTIDVLDAINDAIDNKEGSEVNTLAKIQGIIDFVIVPIRAVNKIAQYAQENGGSDAPEESDYVAAGVTLGSATVNEVNLLIKSLEKEEVNTSGEIQNVVARVIALNKIEAYADDGTKPIPTLSDYDDAGVIRVTVDNIDAVNVTVEKAIGKDVDTTAELQLLIDATVKSVASINKIATYADKDGDAPAPEQTDFDNIGISLPSNVTIEEVNLAIKDLDKADVDTVLEVSNVVKSVSALNKIEAYADDNTKDKPTVQDYKDAGVIGVTDENLNAVNSVVDTKNGEEVDTLSELKEVIGKAIESINSLNKIIEYAVRNGTVDAPTLQTYANAGIDIPIGTSLDDINDVIKSKNKGEVDSIDEIQSIVDGVVALNKIIAYADDNTKDKPTVQDYEDAGVIGVTDNNLDAVNKAVDDVEGSNVDTLSELHSVVNEAVTSVKAMNEIANYADSNGTSNPKPTLTTYTNAGIENVTNDNLSKVNAMIASLTKGAVDTKDEIQGVVDHVIALMKIQSYTQTNSGDEPTIGDFSDINVNGVTVDNLSTIKSYLSDDNLDSSDVASSIEVQAIINAVEAINNLAKDNSQTPTSANYTTLELLMASSTTLSNETSLLNDVIEDKTPSDVDSSAKAHTIAGIVEKVIAYINSNGDTNEPSLEELNLLGLNPVVSDGNILGTLLQLKAEDADGVDTLSELNALVTVVNNAIDTIKDAAQNNNATDTTPDISTYTTAGIVNVSNSNLASINDVLNTTAIDASSINGAVEIQDIVNAYNEILAGSDGVDNDNITLAASDYAKIGVEGISDGVEVDLLNDILDNISDNTKLDDVADIQTYLDIIEKLQEIASGVDTEPFDVTQSELESIGLINLTEARTTDLLNTLASEENVPSSLLELQGKVDITAVDKPVEDDDTDLVPDSAGEFVIIDEIANARVTNGSTVSDLTPSIKYKLTDEAKSGDIIKIYVANAQVGSYEVKQSDIDSSDKVVTVIFDDENALEDGESYALQISVTDPALNESIKSDSITINTKVVQTVVTEVSFSKDENIKGDLITNQYNQTITATLSNELRTGEVIYYRLDDSLEWQEFTGTVVGTKVTLENQVLLLDKNQLEFKVEKGEYIGDTESFDYRLDISAPNIFLSDIKISADSGDVNDDFIANIENQDISVKLSASLSDDEKLYGSVDGGVSWHEVTTIDSSDSQNIIATWNTNLIAENDTTVSSKYIIFKVMDTAGNPAYSGGKDYVYDNVSISHIQAQFTTPTTGIVPVNDGDFVIVNDKESDNIHAVSINTTINDTTPSFNVNLPSGLSAGDFINIYNGDTLLKHYEIQSDDGDVVLVELDSILPNASNYLFNVEFETLSGNKSTKSDDVTLNIDGVGPEQTISEITLSKDEGVTDKDGITNIAEQTLKATLSDVLKENETLKVSIDGGPWQDISHAVEENGTKISWDYTLLEDKHTVKMRVFDEHDNGGAIRSKSYELDTEKPDFIVKINSINGDTGSNITDFITNKAEQSVNATLLLSENPDVEKTLSTSEELYYQLNGGEWLKVENQRTIGSDVNVAITLSKEGDNELKFKVMDTAGNDSIVYDKTIHLDTAIPTTKIDADGISISADLGYKDNDYITKEVTQTIKAKLDNPLANNELLFARVDGGTWKNITSSISAEGDKTDISWITDLVTGDGRNIEIVVSTVAGTHGPVSKQAYLLDTVKSDHVLSGIDLEDLKDTGHSSEDFITNIRLQSISASLDKALGSDDRLFARKNESDEWIDITEIGVTGTSISWNNVILDLGVDNKIQFEVRDKAGNVASSIEQKYTVDQTPPSTLAFKDDTLTISSDTGELGDDFITKDAIQTIRLELENELGEDRLFGRVDGEKWIDITDKVSKDAQGAIKLEWDNVELKAGQSRQIELKIEDTAGNLGDEIFKSYKLDTTAPTANILENSIKFLNYGTLDEDKTDFNTNQTTQTIEAKLNTILGNGEILKARINGGAWEDITNHVSTTSVSWTTDLVSGDGKVEFQVFDIAGNFGELAKKDYTLDITDPTVDLQDDTLKLLNDTGEFRKDFITKTAEQQISVTLDKALSRDDQVYGRVDSGEFENITEYVSLVDGEYVLNWDTDLQSGTNKIEIKILDKAGNLGDTISKIYKLDTTKPLVSIDNVSLSNDDDNDFIVKDSEQTISARLSAPLNADEKLYYRVDGGKWKVITVTGTTISVDVELVSGENAIEFKVSDTAGNDGPISNTTYKLVSGDISTVVENIDISDDNGASDTDFITNQQSQTITANLTKELGEFEKLVARVDGGEWIDITHSIQTNTQTNKDTNISWDTTLLSGDGKIEIRVKNAANAFGAHTPVDYKVDITDPTITIASLKLSKDEGTFVDDFITNVSEQTIIATLSSNIADTDRILGRVDTNSEYIDITSYMKIDENNKQYIEWPVNLLSGENKSIEIVVEDLAGNKGEVKAQPYVFDTVDPTADITTVEISSDTGIDKKDFITKTKNKILHLH